MNRHGKILVIEDNPGDFRLILEWMKAGEGPPELVPAETLGKGLIRLAEGGLDLVLLDLTLPDSTGIETFRKVYSHADPVPIIVLTGSTDEELGAKAVHEGAEDYLLKCELNQKALVRSVRYSIERKRLETELKEKVRELERVNRILAFGRDLEIEELRREIRRLKITQK